MRIRSCNTVVVGAGAAGLNAADELKRRGVDVLLVCDALSGGTSLNAGSDKQTFYKLSMAGGAPESVAALADSFFAGGGMHGDHAYAMAALSARNFMKLALLGVPFPHNEWGEYVGYQTDHDASQRATSAGPLTSKMMAEALLASVRARGVPIEEGLTLLSILRDAQGAARGVMLLDGREEVLVNARNVVLCTGGAALVYRRRVFPEAQCGATGAALRAGARANNLCYWQYGLASVKVRWNVSGSYQQAIPAYTDGADEFLAPHFRDAGDALDSVFLKGYQWPFDARKRDGSSRVDAAVQALCAAGGHAYLDFTREPYGDALSRLGPEGRAYLEKCAATQGRPIERLAAINQAAVNFYRDRGIDLAREPLEVAVCAQHANGGLWIDRWWRTSIPGVYAAGECAGAFGMYRPGGSALNETQTGSLRAAEHIAAHTGRQTPCAREAFLDAVREDLAVSRQLFFAPDGEGEEAPLDELCEAMDACAGAVRSVRGMRALKARVEAALSRRMAGSPLSRARALDTLAVQRAALSAMLCQAEYAGAAGHDFCDVSRAKDAPPAARYAFETEDGVTRAVPLRPMPQGGGWFEEVWKRYERGEVFE